MKEVLVVDANPMFRQFIKEKLSAEKINVENADSKRDAFLHMLNQLPNLVIFDHFGVDGNNDVLFEFLEKKQTNPNTIKIPVIVTGPEQSREKVSLLSKYNVIKYFSKPIKYDMLFEAVSNILRVPIPLDSTPCVLDVHANDNIIFVEIAQGLNREKLALLKYRLGEIIDKNELKNPKVVIMLTGLDLSFVDGSNLELLFDNVIADSRIKNENVKILSLDQFTKELIEGHPQYYGFEVVSSLANVLGSLVSENSGDIQSTIADNILKTGSDFEEGAVGMRFASDTAEKTAEDKVLTPMKVAIVDDDPNACALLKKEFEKTGSSCTIFNSGVQFVNALRSMTFDIISLDLYMPELTGFDVLQQLKMKGINTPVVVYSQLTQREMIMRALSMGAKAYVMKNQSPDAVVRKAREIIG